MTFLAHRSFFVNRILKATFLVCFVLSSFAQAQSPDEQIFLNEQARLGVGPAAEEALAEYQYRGTEIEHAFFAEIADRMESVLVTNQDRMELIYNCFAGLRSDEICNEETRITRKNILLQYPRLRQVSILYKLFDKRVVRHLFEGFKKQTRNLVGKSSSAPNKINYIEVFAQWPFWKQRELGKYKVSNPIANELAIGLPRLELLPQEVLGALEGEKFNINYMDVFDEACRAHGTDFESICDQINLRFDIERMQFYFDPVFLTLEEYEAMEERLEILTLDTTSIRRLGDVPGELGSTLGVLTRVNQEILGSKQDWAKTTFISEVNKYPHVMLVSSQNPSDEELADIFLELEDYARNDLEDVLILVGKVKLGTASRKEKLSLLRYEGVLSSVIEKADLSRRLVQARFLAPSDFHWGADVAQFLQIEAAKKQAIKLGLTIGGLIAANVAVCWTNPAGRILGPIINFAKGIRAVGMALNVRRRVSQTAGCIPITGLTMNIGFLGYSLYDYNKVYDEIFLTTDNESFLRDIESLDSREKAVLLEMFTFPIGIGLGNAITKVVPWLKPSTVKLLAERISRLRASRYVTR